MGGKSMPLVLGTERVTQAAWVISCVPLRGKADEDSGSNPGYATLTLSICSVCPSLYLFLQVEPDILEFLEWFS